MQGGAVNFVYHVIFWQRTYAKSNCFVLPSFNTDPLFLNQLLAPDVKVLLFNVIALKLLGIFKKVESSA